MDSLDEKTHQCIDCTNLKRHQIRRELDMGAELERMNKRLREAHMRAATLEEIVVRLRRRLKWGP